MNTSRDRLRTLALGAWAVLALVYLFVPILVIVALFSFNDSARAASTSRGRASRWSSGRTRSGRSRAWSEALANSLLDRRAGHDAHRGGARHVHGARARPPPLAAGGAATERAGVPAARDARGGAGRGSAGLVPDAQRARAASRRSSSRTSCSRSATSWSPMKARLEGMDLHIEEAAMDLGANAVDDDPQDHDAADRAGHRRRGAAGASPSRWTTSSSRASTPARRARSRCSSSAPRARACRRRSTCWRPRCCCSCSA